MEKQKISYITNLRVISMLMIIITHVIGMSVVACGNTEIFNQFSLRLAIVLTYLTREGVQLFLMISGALFLRKEREITIKTLFCKYILRLIIALFLFGAVFSLMEYYFTYRKFSWEMFYVIFVNFIQDKSWGHLWYIYVLIGLYLITPIIKKFINNADKNELIYFAILLFIFTIVFNTIREALKINIAFEIPITGSFIFFYYIGYLISSEILKISNKICISMLLLLVIILVLEAIFTKKISITSVTFDCISRYQIILWIFPVSVFGLFHNNIRKKSKKIIGKMELLSFGIYLIHPFFLHVMYKVVKIYNYINSVYLIWIIVFFVDVVLSVLTTMLIRKIPFFKKYVL